MTRNRPTNVSPKVGAVISALLFAVILAPLNAQTLDDSRHYDIHKEVTVTGIVSGVLTKSSPGMVWGPHVLISTVTGPMDVSLGRWSVRKGGVSVAVGQHVEVTGVPTTFNQAPIFIARTIRLNGKVFTVRDERGIPISPQARRRLSQERESQ